MKKIISLILLIFITIIGCSDDNPLTGKFPKAVSYRVTGSQNDVLITSAGASGVTQYVHVSLPFTLYPFNMNPGEFIGFSAVDWNGTDSIMVAEILIDGSVYKSISGSGKVELYGSTP